MYVNQMAVENPYGVKAVSEEDAALMRAYTPACVALIDGCQDVPEVCECVYRWVPAYLPACVLVCMCACGRFMLPGKGRVAAAVLIKSGAVIR